MRENIRTVRFDISHGSSVSYLNILVQNRNGELYTRIDHESAIQKYRLPFVVGHSKLAHSDWLRSALIRATCCCSSVSDFHEEKTYLELTCLINGYPLLFVNTHLQHFFNYFNMSAMRYAMNQDMYKKFRQLWFDYMSVQHDLTDELQKFDENGQLVYLNYIYEYGPRCQFNKKFYHLWSNYFNQHPNLSKDKLKILIEPKHFQTLHSLFCSKKLTNLIE